MDTTSVPQYCSTCLFCTNLSIYSDSKSKCDPVEAEVELVQQNSKPNKTRRNTTTTTTKTTTEKSKTFKQSQNQFHNFKENVRRFYELFQLSQEDPFVRELDSFINASMKEGSGSGSICPVCEKCQNRIELISDIMEEIKCFEAKLTKLKTIVQQDFQLDPLSSKCVDRMLKKKKLMLNVEFDRKTRIFRDKLRQTLQLPSNSEVKTDIITTTATNNVVVGTNSAVPLKDHDYIVKSRSSTGAGPVPGPGSSSSVPKSLLTYKYKIEDGKKNPKVVLIPMTILRSTKASDKTIVHCDGVDHEVNMGFNTNARDIKKEPETEPDSEAEDEHVEEGEIHTNILKAFCMLSDTDDNPDECIQDFIDDTGIISEDNLEELKEPIPKPKSPMNVEEPITIKEEVIDSCQRKEPLEPKSNTDSGCSGASEIVRLRKPRPRSRVDPDLVKAVQCSFVDPKSGECRKMFEDELRRDAHINRIHKNMDPRFAYKCDLCPFGARDKRRLDEHKKIHSGLRDFICEKCGQAFRNERNLNNHKRSKHGEEYPYICIICDLGFNNPSDLKLHHKESHNDGTSAFSYTCTVCSKGFYAKFRFDAHMLRHAGPSFACDECPRKYLTKHSLQQHKLTHTGIRPFVCDICGWSFFKRQKLDTHYTIHTKKRPFLCQECGFSCRLQSILTSHLKVHEKNKNKLGTGESPGKAKRPKLTKPRNRPVKANRHANNGAVPVKPQPVQPVPAPAPAPAPPTSCAEDVMKPPLSPSSSSPVLSLPPPPPPPDTSMASPPPSPPPPDMSLPPPPPSPPDLTLSTPTLVPILDDSAAPFSFIPAQELLGGLDDHSELVVGEHIEFISVSLIDF